ncbi:MAG: sensor histidine kinase [Chloroflexota bacterium]|jgi:two-component system sensor histidine kinase DegS
MSNSPPRVISAIEALNTTIELFNREKTAMADQRKEIGVLIKQAVAEIDRLTQRNRETSSQVRQLEANIESFPRTEIKQIYSTHQESQMRLFMMQTQLEHLRSRQANLERTEQLLDGFLQMTESLLQLDQASGSEGFLGSAAKPASSLGMSAVIDSIETAKLRLSRQLQDGPLETMSDLILRCEVCERLATVDAEKSRDELVLLRLALSQALNSIRQLIYELQPPTFEELGLGVALRKYLETSRLSERLQTNLEISGQEKRLPESVELAIFRILQEALANCFEHSRARRVNVTLRYEDAQLLATVTDDGQGFDATSSLSESRQKKHSGLSDMKGQAEVIGATLEVVSNPGSGCVVSLAVPISSSTP